MMDAAGADDQGGNGPGPEGTGTAKGPENSRKRRKTAAEKSASQPNQDEETTSSSSNSRKETYDEKKVVRQRLESGELDYVEKEIKDEKDHYIWEVFKIVRQLNPSVHLEWAYCTQCCNVLTYKADDGVSNLGRHLRKCPNRPGQAGVAAKPLSTKVPDWARQEFLVSQAQYCARDLRAPASFSGPGMQAMLQKAIDIGAGLGRVKVESLISSPATVAVCLKKQAAKANQELVMEINLVIEEDLASGTMDGWTEAHTNLHYLVLTLQYINRLWQLMCRTLFFIDLPSGERSASHIRLAVNKKLADMNIRAKVEELVMVTDGGKDMVNACGDRRMYCFGHGANVVVRNVFTVKFADVIKGAFDASEEAQEIVATCDAWVQDVRKLMPRGNGALLKLLRCSNASQSNYLPPLLSVTNCRERVETILAEKSPPLLIDQEKFVDLISFLTPLDLAGTRGKSPDISAKKRDELVAHCSVEEGDSAFLAALNHAAARELIILEAGVTITCTKELVTYVNNSSLKGNLTQTLKQEVASRWNTHRPMLSSVHNQWDEVEVALDSVGEQSRLSTIDREVVADLIEFLIPFEAHTTKLQGKDYPTLPYVLLSFNRLLTHCEPKLMDSELMTAIRVKATRLLKEHIMVTTVHKMATFLWPRFKSLDVLTQSEKDEVYSAVRMEIGPGPGEAPVPVETVPIISLVESAAKRGRLSIRDEDLFGSFFTGPPQALDEDEVDRYIRMTPGDAGDDSDLLQWWKVQGSARFPQLSKLAKRILAIPATSNGSESAFSDAKTLISDKRSSMKPSTVDCTLSYRDVLRKSGFDMMCKNLDSV